MWLKRPSKDETNSLCLLFSFLLPLFSCLSLPFLSSPSSPRLCYLFSSTSLCPYPSLPFLTLWLVSISFFLGFLQALFISTFLHFISLCHFLLPRLLCSLYALPFPHPDLFPILYFLLHWKRESCITISIAKINDANFHSSVELLAKLKLCDKRKLNIESNGEPLSDRSKKNSGEQFAANGCKQPLAVS